MKTLPSFCAEHSASYAKCLTATQLSIAELGVQINATLFHENVTHMAGKRSANRFGNRRPWASCFTNPRVLLSFLAVCIPSSLYIAYSLPKQSAKPNLHNILSTQDGENSPKPAFEWKPGPKRLVVFGDSWSDNGKHPVNAPGDDQALSKSEDQGRSWTEWFCQEVCNPRRLFEV